MKEGLYGGKYFRDIYSHATNKWYSGFGRYFHDIIYGNDPKYFNSRFYDTPINKYGVACSTNLRFWEDEGHIKSIDSYGWFQWYFSYWFGRRSHGDENKLKYGIG